MKDWNFTARPWYSSNARVEANGTPGHEDGELAAALKGVRQREEGEEDVLPHVEI